MRISPLIIPLLTGWLLGGAAEAAGSRCGSFAGDIVSHEVGGCGWSENCYHRPSTSSAQGCFGMTHAALVDVGLKYRNGHWRPNRWEITSDQEFQSNWAAQKHAFRQYTALNWQRLEPVRGLVGQEINGVRITEGGLLSAAHFLGPGGVRQLADCGFRPDCISDDAAAANGGHDTTFQITMNRLAQGSNQNAGLYAGVQTTGGGGQFTGTGNAGPTVPTSAFLQWNAQATHEMPPLQGERQQLR
ncbi:MAG: hypothetical protein OXE84_07700 [Rhodobacteraceae bacterium]|nr:hypothetical protein [Paracoccaceae bacterium]MCY4195485.1 hypothetical protein [Paracoccaceae bacterium]MCY4326266.1 hypothetical protein [Paracoccaceae bacterium]